MLDIIFKQMIFYKFWLEIMHDLSSLKIIETIYRLNNKKLSLFMPNRVHLKQLLY